MREKEVAIGAALEAGKIVMKWFGKVKEFRFKSKDQIVTLADEESQGKIVKIITKSFPDHSIIAEENLDKRTASPFRWYVDPIDGTNNFLHDFPYFCISIALQHESDVVLGVVYNPVSKEMFVAQKGKGATMNGKKINVSSKVELRKSLLIFDAGLHRETERKLSDLSFFVSNVFRVRVLGAAALDLANIAQGAGDASVTYKINSWDIAAGALIVEEAGGVVTDFKGRPWHPDMSCIVATNGKIHGQVLKRLSKN